MRNRRLRSTSTRRRTTWATVDQTFTLAAANDYFTLDLLANFKADGGVQQAVTVVRTHLLWAVTSEVTPGDQFAFGLIRGQTADEGSNIAGAPEPATDLYEDWMLWQRRVASSVLTGSGDGNGVYSAQGLTNTLEFDLKAQRRFEELNMSYNLVVQAVSSQAGFPQVHEVTGRILLMLP